MHGYPNLKMKILSHVKSIEYVLPHFLWSHPKSLYIYIYTFLRRDKELKIEMKSFKLSSNKQNVCYIKKVRADQLNLAYLIVQNKSQWNVVSHLHLKKASAGQSKVDL